MVAIFISAFILTKKKRADWDGYPTNRYKPDI